MKKLITLNLILLFTILNISCSGDDSSDGNNTPEIMEVVTLSATNIEGVNVVLGGRILNNGGSPIQLRGVCWSTDGLPTRDSENYREDYINQLGEFQFAVENQLQPNTVYYARAYAANLNGGFEYGEVISFTTGNLEFLTTLPPTDILTTKATLRGHITQNPNETSEIRFVYSTSPNPTINDATTFTYVSGTDDFEVNIENLQHSTVYYVRTAIFINNTYTYGEQKEFKTTGYTGPAGGYVAYDMGEENDGWRYLELYPVTLSYNPNYTHGGAWGTYNMFIPGTTDLFGSGPQNTEIIATNDPAANCAAKLCKNAEINGYSDWFLPSAQELLLIANSLYEVNLLNIDYTWTSTQNNSDFAYTVAYNHTNSSHYLFDSYPKSFENLKIYPVRRYL